MSSEFLDLFSKPAFSGIMAFLAVVFAIAATWYAYRSLKLSKQIAVAQRVFDRKSLSIRLFGHEKIRDLVIALPLPEKSVVEVPLCVSYTNESSTSLDEVQIVMHMNKELSYGDAFGDYSHKTSQHVGETKVSEFGEKRAFQLIFDKPFYPGTRFDARYPITLKRETKIARETPVKSTDDINMLVSWQAWFSWSVDIIFHCDDEKPTATQVGITVINTLAGNPLDSLKSVKKPEDRLNADGILPFLYFEIPQSELDEQKLLKRSGVHIYSAMDVKLVPIIGFFDRIGGKVWGMPAMKLKSVDQNQLKWLVENGYTVESTTAPQKTGGAS